MKIFRAAVTVMAIGVEKAGSEMEAPFLVAVNTIIISISIQAINSGRTDARYCNIASSSSLSYYLCVMK